MHFIGIDIGTTNIKTGLFNETGTLISFSTNKTPVVASKSIQGSYEYDVELLYKCICDEIKYVCKNINTKTVASISFSSFGEPGVPLDENMKPLTTSVIWYDTRSIPEADKLCLKLGEEKIYNITGQNASYKFGITKLLWFKNHCPDLFKKCKYWMSINDYMVYKFTGRRVIEYSIASRTMAFDVQKLSWSDEICSAAEITPEMFSSPVPGGTAVDVLTKKCCEDTGLSSKTILVTGGHDHSCAAIGAGSLSQKSMLYSMGTSEVSLFIADTAKISHDAFLTQCAIYPHCSSNLYRYLSSMQACGGSIDWILNSIIHQNYEWAETASTSVNPVSNLFYFPFIRGLNSCKHASGVFWGLSDKHTSADILNAVFNGLCCESAYLTQRCMSLLNLLPEFAFAVGGPTKMQSLMQRKANFSNMHICIPAQKESAVFGAALLGAVGSGYTTFNTIIDSARASSDTYDPAVDRAMYNEYLNKYINIREHILEKMI